jgi:enhancing lycopene biosynthesis protein 2
MVKVGVILSGCGVYDGSEIHEAVCTLLALDQHNAEATCLAPNKLSMDVVDHLAQKPMAEKRNVLVESARIARGKILDLANVRGSDFDAWILPGGFGAAKNLCDFAIAGEKCSVDPDVARVLNEARSAGKPIGLACIAPVIAAQLFGQEFHPAMTIGHDPGTAEKINAMGAKHISKDVDQIAVDETHRLVTTPCYMEAKRIRDVYTGIEKLVGKVLELASTPVEA